MGAAIVVAVAAALCFAGCSVAQHRAAGQVEHRTTGDPGLLLRLVRRPLWLMGVVLDGAGLLLQALALGLGAVVIVQPLLVSGLLFAVPLSAAVEHRRPGRGDLAGAALCAAGLAAFVLGAHPADVHHQLPAERGAVACAVIGIVSLGLLVPGYRARASGSARHAALPLAGAAGLLLGLSAVAMSVVVDRLDHPFALLTNWALYLLLIAGGAGFLLSQNAFQAGSLAAPLALLTILEPFTAAIMGVTVLDQSLSTRPLDLLLDAVACVTVVTGVVLLARGAAAPVVVPMHGQLATTVEQPPSVSPEGR